MSTKGTAEKKIIDKQTKFAENDKLFCYHHGLIYEAKCIGIQPHLEKPNEVQYKIHYNGWNKNWDEWVDEDRLLEYNDENRKKKDELSKTSSKTTSKKSYKRRTSIGSLGDKDENNSRSNSPKPVTSRKSAPLSSNRTSLTKLEKPDPRKRKFIFAKPEYRERIVIKVHLPDELRLLLIYDFDLICKRKKCVKLPARVTVDETTELYIKHKTSLFDNVRASIYREVALAIKDYFNTVLSVKLLYPSEKQQFTKLSENKTDLIPSSVYSVVHLARLLVKLGRLMTHLPVSENSSTLIEETINDYVRYLNMNIGKFISLDDYQTAPDFQRKAKETNKN